MKQAIRWLNTLNTVVTYVITYILFVFIDAKELGKEMSFFEWKYVIVAGIASAFVFFLTWSIRKIIILSVRSTILHTDEQKWIFIRDTLLEKIYKEKGEDFYEIFIVEVNGKKRLKYDNEFMESIGLSKDNIEDLRDWIGTHNTLPKLGEFIADKIADKLFKKDESNPDKQ